MYAYTNGSCVGKPQQQQRQSLRTINYTCQIGVGEAPCYEAPTLANKPGQDKPPARHAHSPVVGWNDAI